MKNGKNLSTFSEHRRHDRLLVTRYAVDDAYPSERDEAEALVASCTECAALASDVRAISGSLTSLPELSRPRDFTISQEQADQLRGSTLSRFLRRLGASAPLWGTVRPVAAAALSIGLVAAMAGTALPNQAATFEDRSTIQMPAPLAAASGEPVAAPEISTRADGGPAGVPGPTGAPDVLEQAVSEDDTSKAMNEAYVEAAGGEGPASDGNSFNAEPSGPSATAATGPASTKDLLIYAGLMVALISAALLSVAWFARRYFADPLLR